MENVHVMICGEYVCMYVYAKFVYSSFSTYFRYIYIYKTL
jgi:hypothetical protein